MTINQALDKILSIKNRTTEQDKLRVSLMELKQTHGGNTMIENDKEVKEIILDKN